jgi:hypothetical protein
MPITTRRQTASSSLNSSPIIKKVQQKQPNEEIDSHLREEISRSLYLGDFDRAHRYFYELLHPSKGPFPWTDIHDYARFLLTINLPMRAFRVLRKSDLLEHPIAGFIAVEALIMMSKDEIDEADKNSKLNEANEVLYNLQYIKTENLTKSHWGERRERLVDKINILSNKKLDHRPANSDPYLFSTDQKNFFDLIRRQKYEKVIELGNYYGASPIAIPNEFLPAYLYSLFQCKKKDELFHLAQWLIDEQGHLPYAWYGAALYYKLLLGAINAAGSSGPEDKVKRFFLKSVAKDSTFIEGWLGIGELYSGRTGDHDLAIKAFKNALNCAISQGSQDAIEWSSLFLAHEYLRVKKPAEALQVIEGFSGNGDERFLNERIVSLYQLGRVKEARQILSDIDLYDDHLLMNFASVLIKLGDFHEAHVLLSKINSSSVRKEIHFLRLHSFVNEILGFTTLDDKLLLEAIDAYNLLLEKDPHDIFSKNSQDKTRILYKHIIQAKLRHPFVNGAKAEDGNSHDEIAEGEAEMDCD